VEVDVQVIFIIRITVTRIQSAKLRKSQCYTHRRIQGEAIRPCPIMVLRTGLSPLSMLQKELLKVGGSWRSAGFFSLASLRLHL